MRAVYLTAYFFFIYTTDLRIRVSSTFKSTSASLLMYRHDFPVSLRLVDNVEDFKNKLSAALSSSQSPAQR